MSDGGLVWNMKLVMKSVLVSGTLFVNVLFFFFSSSNSSSSLLWPSRIGNYCLSRLQESYTLISIQPYLARLAIAQKIRFAPLPS